jgi:hypothetical protein
MKKLLFLLLFLFSCATPRFFHARVIGPYYPYFKNQLLCGMIEGWDKKPKCMCEIEDPSFSIDKTFILVDPAMCSPKNNPLLGH